MQCVSNSRRTIAHINIVVPHEIKNERYLQLSGIKEKMPHNSFCLNIRITRRKMVHTNIKIPHVFKDARYFQLSSNKKDIYCTRFLKAMTKSRLPILYTKKCSHLCVKLDLSSELILVQRSPLLAKEGSYFCLKDLPRVN